ncbi:MAG: prolyl oligopeptidase family serine peptidase [bacterium]
MLRFSLMPKYLLFVFFTYTGLSIGQEKTELTVAKIMQGTSWIGHSPRNLFWSEDSKRIYFYWNPENADADSLYKIAPKDGSPEKVSLVERKAIPAARGIYSRDYSKKLFIRDGDLFLYHIKQNDLIRLTRTLARENNARFSQNETAVTFQQGNSLFQIELNTGSITQIVEFAKGKKPKDDPQPGTDIEKYLRHEEMNLIKILDERKAKSDRRRQVSREQSDAPPKIYINTQLIENPALSPDGRFVTVRLRQNPKDGKRTIVPSYVDESGFAKDLTARPKVGSPNTTYKFAFVDLSHDSLIYIRPDTLPGIFDTPEYTEAPKSNTKTASKDNSKKRKSRNVVFWGPYWSKDGQNAFVVAGSRDNKDRWLALLDLPSGNLTPFEHQHDEAWIGGPNIFGRFSGGSVGWMPDNQRIWFFSEETGYSHLYTYDVATHKKQALTSGEFEVYSPSISRDKKFWYFTANNAHPGERHFYRMPLEGGKWEKLTSLPGRNEALLSPDGKQLLVRRSYMNQPWELYVQKARTGAEVQQLTTSTTKEWRAYPWRIPEIVRIPASDGAKPYARLYRPDRPNGAGVIFVHGAGYLQNAHKWWSSYYREYMFHNLLADKGYTVLDIDYRGSAGYGRDWRTAIYRHMGGKDLDDQVDGAKYLIDALGVDPNRIGIYGGSYGGFITLMAMFTKPEIFKAGAALRSVTDWAHYNHGYTSNILNIPQADTLAFRRSSPIYYFAEGLKGHLLMCHGMIDTNVHFQDVVRLAQRLIELGKENWELAVYPLEGHGFREPSSWTDEYSRILKLFEETLNK